MGREEHQRMKKAFRAEIDMWARVIDHDLDPNTSSSGACDFFSSCSLCPLNNFSNNLCDLDQYYTYADYVDTVNSVINMNAYVFDKVSHAFIIQLHNDVIDLYIDYLKNGLKRTTD